LPNSISPARSAAFEVLLELRRKPESHSDVLLRSKRVDVLSALDRNLATTLVMGVLRWQIVLQQRIREALTKGKGHLGDPVQVALELGAVQLLLLDRIPAHAAIFESVELTRHSGNNYAVGLVNAVLRKLAQTSKLSVSEAMSAHPAWMVDRWITAYGMPVAETICSYDQVLPPTTVRLASGTIEPEVVDLVAGRFVSRARKVVAGDTANLRLRIQDEGSQFVAELAGRGTRILDCCAAPGGKTSILAERNPDASITACDVSPARLKAMQVATKKSKIEFRVLDATELPFRRVFDLVLCDAPCSGTGTLARNPEIRHRVTVEDFKRHHDRQVRLLTSALSAVREGGRVLYSTCSLEVEENERVVEEVLERHTEFRLLPWREPMQDLENTGVLNPGTTANLCPVGVQDHYLRLIPGAYPGDGFFVACLTL
jgi:16S rRNA (cytosine967-C5)-methyltransferase